MNNIFCEITTSLSKNSFNKNIFLRVHFHLNKKK